MPEWHSSLRRTENDAHGPFALYLGWCDVLTLRRRVLLRGGKGDPELEYPRRLAGQHTAVVPHTTARLHPLQSTRRKHTLLSGRIFIGDLPGKDRGQRGKAGVRVDAECGLVARIDCSVIQEHERLDGVPDVGWADQAGNRPVPTATSPNGDAAKAARLFRGEVGKRSRRARADRGGDCQYALHAGLQSDSTGAR